MLSATLLSACTWQVPENVRFRGSPQVAIPLGSALFDFDDIVNVGELKGDFAAALSTAGGFNSAVVRPATDPITIDAETQLGNDVSWTGGSLAFTIGSLNLSKVFGPFPAGVGFQSVPLTVAVDLSGSFSGNIDVALTADYDGSQQHDFGTVDPTSPDNEFGIEEAINARPSDLELQFTITADSGDVANIDSITITLTLPFDFELERVDPGNPDSPYRDDIALDLSDEEDPEDKPFEFDDDIFGRDPADPDEDLNDFIDSLRGSNAEIVMELDNTVGLTPIVRLSSAVGSAVGEGVEIVKTPTPPQDGAFTFIADITPTGFNRMVDSNPFYSKLEFLLPPTFQLNDGGELRVLSGYVRAQARMDYTFTFDQEEE